MENTKSHAELVNEGLNKTEDWITNIKENVENIKANGETMVNRTRDSLEKLDQLDEKQGSWHVFNFSDMLEKTFHIQAELKEKHVYRKNFRVNWMGYQIIIHLVDNATVKIKIKPPNQEFILGGIYTIKIFNDLYY